MKAFTWLAVPSLLWCAYTHSASALTVDNSSFQATAVDTPPGYNVISAGPSATQDFWVYSGVAGIQNLSGNGFSSDGTANGTQDAWINGVGTITSTDSFTIAANTDYVLTVALGERDDIGSGQPAPGTMTLSLVDTTGSVTLGSTTVTASTPGLTAGTFADFQVSLTPEQIALVGGAVGDSMTIQLGQGENGNVQGNFDNVRLDVIALPEPATYAMLFGGLGMLVLVSRFRSKLTA
jgi:hypothetical protein